MDPESINTVIDKLAEQAGVAVDAARPIAEVVVRETATNGLAHVLAGCAVLLVSAIAAVALWCAVGKCIEYNDKHPDETTFSGADVRAVATGIVAAVAGLAGVSIVGNFASEWLAPTRYVLEMMLKAVG